MKLLIISIAVLALSVFTVSAHIHPLVPANECALGPGAGNTADPQNRDSGGVGNGQKFIVFPNFIPNDNPGKADVSLLGPGVKPATANCANALVI